MTYQLLIFDWEGTLCDPQGQRVKTLHQLLTAEELAFDGRLFRQYLNNPRGYLQQFTPALSTQLIENIIGQYQAIISANISKRHDLFHGVESMLAQLKEQGYQMAIATGRGRSSLIQDLQDFSVQQFFTSLMTADEGIYKPDPAVLTTLLLAEGVTAELALMIGDSEADIRAAKNVGADALLVAQAGINDYPISCENMLACLNDITDLPSWLETKS